MKRTITISMMLAAASIAFSQSQLPELPRHKEDRHSATIPYKGPVAEAKSGSTYFSEDFDAGLNGWTVSTVSGVAWEVTNVGPGPTSSTYPVPALNTSTPANWLMVDDDFLGGGLVTNTSLISPVIDLSTAPPNLKVEFDQYFQEWQLDQCYVGVSTDGGLTWNEVEVNAGVGRDGRPNPELVDVNISTWVAADPSNVQLRFRYESEWDYGWQIDNVTIKDLPNNDMALLQAYQTAYDFDATNLSFGPYSIYPTTQLQEMILNGEMKNKGFVQQTGVQFNVDVTGPGGASVFSGASSPISMTPGQVDLPQIIGFTPPTTLGEYTVNFDVSQTEVDEVPADNAISSTFEVSNDIYALDRGAADGATDQGPDEAGSQFELGNFYEFVSDGVYITGVQVAVDENSVVGTLIYGVIYDANLDAPVALSDDYELTTADLTAPGGANFITIPFDPPFEPFLGEFYCVMAGHYGGPDDVLFSISGQSPQQISIIRYPNTPAPDDNFFTTRTPMVRAIVSDNVSVQETMIGAADVNIWPNPFSDGATVDFDMASSARVNFELIDLQGKVILTLDLGVLAPGQQRIQISGGDLNAGPYTWTLRAGESIRTGTLVKLER